MFGIGHRLRRHAPAATHVVARAAPEAPCGWVFFDGSETYLSGDEGADLILPGGAFFPREARRFASAEEAGAAASRLNDRSPCLDRPWRVRPVATFDPRPAGRTYALSWPVTRRA